MKWKKLGQLYSPRSVHPKLLSHAANPLAIHLEGDVYRVLYSGRDLQKRSSVGYVDIDIMERKVIYVHDKPVFEHGPDGSFYSHGVSIGNCYEVDGQRYVLFMGWQCPPNGHWRGDIGRLLVGEDFSVHLDGDQPFISSDANDPISFSYPWVLREADGYQMWYGSTIRWDEEDAEMIHVIKHASSKDGHSWKRDGAMVPYELGVAQAFSRPTVVRSDDGIFHMWFSYRSGAGETYRIGYASSQNGIAWKRDLNQAGIDISSSGWDSEMIEYPFVFYHGGQCFMLYNGNGYGETGFGLALLSHD